MTISRRQFLKIAGVTAASTQLASLGLAVEKPQYGRLLSLTAARMRPYENAGTTARLLPDSVHEILDYERGFVRVAAGFVPENRIQPMLEGHFLQPNSLPASVEVITSYAAVREFCAADAPLLARPGHGAVLEAVNVLPDQHGRFNWYQIDLGNGLSGWVQSTQVQQAIETRTLSHTYAVIESHQMTVYRGEQMLAQFALACPVNLPTGSHRITRRYTHLHTESLKGIPWVIQTHRGLQLGGVYWHNQFGGVSQTSHIELSVLAAKSVFALLPEGSRIEVM